MAPFLYGDRSPGLEQRLLLDTSQKGLLLHRHCRILTAKPEPHTSESYTSAQWGLVSGLWRWVPRLWDRQLKGTSASCPALMKAKEAAAGTNRCGGGTPQSCTIQRSCHSPPTSVQILNIISLNWTNIKLQSSVPWATFRCPVAMCDRGLPWWMSQREKCPFLVGSSLGQQCSAPLGTSALGFVWCHFPCLDSSSSLPRDWPCLLLHLSSKAA